MHIDRLRSYRRTSRVTDEKRSRLLTIVLPRGAIDLHLRFTRYGNGSPAIELQDADGDAFYSPTIPVCPITVAEAVPPEHADTLVVAVKPSALRNGIANALVDAGIFLDLGVEIPADRIWARLMRIAPNVFDEPAAPMPDTRPLNRKPLAIPLDWERAAKRIRLAFAREGLAISDEDAMLVWAWHGRAVQRIPKILPPTGAEIVRLLQPYFTEETAGEKPA